MIPSPDSTAELVEQVAKLCGTTVPELRRKRYGRAGVPTIIAHARRVASWTLVHHVGLTRRTAAQRLGLSSGCVWRGCREVEIDLQRGSGETHDLVMRIVGAESPPPPPKPTRRSLPQVPELGECPPDRRRCDRTSCRYHLENDGGTTHMCAMEVANDGPQTLETIAQLFGGISRERVRQIEQIAIAKYRAKCREYGIEAQMIERPASLWERAELAAPGRIDMSLRGEDPENWKR